MSLTKDEEWEFIEPTDTVQYRITIRQKGGSYRTPTKEEVADLLWYREARLVAGLDEVLGLLRALLTECVEDDTEAYEAKVRELQELLK